MNNKAAKSILDDFSAPSSNEDSDSNSISSEHNFFDLPWNRVDNDPDIIQKGTEIKLFPIPEELTKSKLYSIFKGYGDIIGIDCPLREKQVTYIRFSSTEPVKELVALRRIKIGNNNISIYHSNDNATLFLSNLNKNWSLDFFTSALAEKINNYSSVRFLSDPHYVSNNKGYAFVEFPNAYQARKAFDMLTKNMVMKGRALTIDWAKGLDSEKDINKTQLHISGITDDISTEQLFSVLSLYGSIVQLKLSRDLNKDGRKDYGFVTYSSPSEAERALSEFQSKHYFTSEITLQYAKKLTSIISHRKKVQSNVLQRKKPRDYDKPK